MITKKDVKDVMKKYLFKGDKIINIDVWVDYQVDINAWVLVKSENGVIYFYSIYKFGSDEQIIYKGILSLSTVETWKLNY